MISGDESPLLFGNASDVGRVREANEDYLGKFTSGNRQLFVVADGMGGAAGGRQASTTAVRAVQAFFEEHPAESASGVLRGAISAANRACMELQQDRQELKGMGTTLELLLVDGNRAWWGHVGDSRISLVRDKATTRLTKDHTLVQQMLDGGLLTPGEAAEHERRHVLSRVVGRDEKLEPDIADEPLDILDGDYFVMCTDGLSDLVSEEELAWVVSSYGPQRSCERLVRLANDRGGHDNITVQVVYRGRPRKSWQRVKTLADIPRPREKGGLFTPVRVVVAALAALAAITAVMLLRSRAPKPVFEVSANSVRQQGPGQVVDLPVVGAGPLLGVRVRGPLGIASSPSELEYRPQDVGRRPRPLSPGGDPTGDPLLFLRLMAPDANGATLVIQFRLHQHQGLPGCTLLLVEPQVRLNADPQRKGREKARITIRRTDASNGELLVGRPSAPILSLGSITSGRLHTLIVRLAPEAVFVAFDGSTRELLLAPVPFQKDPGGEIHLAMFGDFGTLDATPTDDLVTIGRVAAYCPALSTRQLASLLDRHRDDAIPTLAGRADRERVQTPEPEPTRPTRSDGTTKDHEEGANADHRS